MPFAFLERQLVLCLIGALLATIVFCIRTEYLEKMAWPLLIVRRGAAVRGADPRARPRGQRQPPLDPRCWASTSRPRSWRACWC